MSDAHFDSLGQEYLKSLPREQRALHILEDLKTLRADIIALQEVESELFHDLLEPQLQKVGYSGLYHKRGAMSPFEQREWHSKRADGCALFWRNDLSLFFSLSLLNVILTKFGNRFVLVSSERSELRQAIHESGQGKFGLGDALFLRQYRYYSNIVSIAALRHRTSAHLLAVANTHLYSNQLRSSVQIAQAHVSLHRLSATCNALRSEFGTEPAALFCGDFNAVPSSSLLRYSLPFASISPGFCPS
jgi:CCR4-NOT transcription complex subunit 6